MRKQMLVVAGLAALALAGCQNRDGSTNWGQTIGLGAATGLGAAVIGGAVNDHNNRPAHRGYGYHRQPRHQPQHGSYYGREPYNRGYHPGYDRYGRRVW